MPTKIEKILFLLKERTNSAQLDWEVSEEGDTVEVALGDHIILLSSEPEVCGGDTQYAISILDHERSMIAQLGESDLDIQGVDSSHSFLHDIYESARRNASGLEQAFDEILINLAGRKPTLDDDDLPF
jgi:hypothetical protein